MNFIRHLVEFEYLPLWAVERVHDTLDTPGHGKV